MARGQDAEAIAARLAAAGLPDMPWGAGVGDGPVFQAPWEARIFALVIALVEAGAFPFADFQNRLAAKLGEAESSGRAAKATREDGAAGINRYYFECWLAAAEETLAATGLVAPDAVDTRIATLEAQVDAIRDHQLATGRGAGAGPLANHGARS